MIRGQISTDFLKLYWRVSWNEFLVHTVSGLAAGLFLAFVQVIRLEDVPAFFLAGLCALMPLYVLHLIRSFLLLRKAIIPVDEFREQDLRHRLASLQLLLRIPVRIGFSVPVLWFWGSLFTWWFSWYWLKLPLYLVLFAGTTIFLMGPLVWLVNVVVIKRLLLARIRLYMSEIPETIQSTLNLFRFSTITKALVAVSYMLLMGMYLVIQTSVTSFTELNRLQMRDVMHQHLERLADALTRQQRERTGDPNEMERLILGNSPLKDVQISLKLSDGTLLGNGISRQIEKERDTVILNREVSGIGVLQAAHPGPGQQVATLLIKRGLALFAFIMASVGLIVLLQLGQDFRGTVGRLERIASAIADGDLMQGDGFYARDEFWRMYRQLLVIKANTTRVLGEIRDTSASLSEMVRVTDDASQYLQRLSVEQGRMMQNAGDALAFIESFADRVKQSITDLSASAESTSSTVVEFATAVNQVKNSMHNLVALAERVSGWVHESGSAISDISRTIESVTAYGTSQLAALENTATFMGELEQELEHMGKQTADRSGKFDDADKDGLSATQREIEVMASIVGEYQETGSALRSHLQSMETVMNFIQRFSDQAEILGLNAAIVASQSGGDAGGFGIISDNIRELTRETEEQEQLFGSIINDVHRHLDQLDQLSANASSRIRAIQKAAARTGSQLARLSEAGEARTERLQSLKVRAGEHMSTLGESLLGLRESGMQVRHVHHALQQHETENRMMLETSAEMKSLAEQVMIAAQEQTTGANHIAASSETIKDLSLTTRESAEKLKETMDEMFTMLKELQADSDQTTEKSQRLRHGVEELAEHAGALSNEVARFRIGATRSPGKENA